MKIEASQSRLFDCYPHEAIWSLINPITCIKAWTVVGPTNFHPRLRHSFDVLRRRARSNDFAARTIIVRLKALSGILKRCSSLLLKCPGEPVGTVRLEPSPTRPDKPLRHFQGPIPRSFKLRSCKTRYKSLKDMTMLAAQQAGRRSNYAREPEKAGAKSNTGCRMTTASRGS